MSSEYGVYVLITKNINGVGNGNGLEYRVEGLQYFANVYDDPDYPKNDPLYNKSVLFSFFRNSPVLKTLEDAQEVAERLADYGTEYGINTINNKSMIFPIIPEQGVVIVEGNFREGVDEDEGHCLCQTLSVNKNYPMKEMGGYTAYLDAIPAGDRVPPKSTPVFLNGTVINGDDFTKAEIMNFAERFNWPAI